MFMSSLTCECVIDILCYTISFVGCCFNCICCCFFFPFWLAGAREFIRVTRKSEHGDVINSALGGSCSGAVLGRLQGGQRSAVRCSIMFAIAGTALDFATLKLQPVAKSHYLSSANWKLPEWSPIKILDEEALAAK